jgi:hypothetical protein
MPNRNNRSLFGTKIRFGVEMTELSQPVFKNLLW